MAKKPDLAKVISNAGGGTRKKETAQPTTTSEKSEQTVEKPYRQPGRSGMKAITIQCPPNVRDQLKILAIEQGTTAQNLVAEALNDLFAKYGKPEIVPVNER